MQKNLNICQIFLNFVKLKLINRINFYFFAGAHPNLFTFDEYCQFIKYQHLFYIRGGEIVLRLEYLSAKLLTSLYLKKVDGFWKIFASTNIILSDRLISNGDKSLKTSIDIILKLFNNDLFPTCIINFENEYIRRPTIKHILNMECMPEDEICNILTSFKDNGFYISHKSGYLYFVNSRKPEIVQYLYSNHVGFEVILLRPNSIIDANCLQNEISHFIENLKILHKDYIVDVRNRQYVIALYVYKYQKKIMDEKLK